MATLNDVGRQYGSSCIHSPTVLHLTVRRTVSSVTVGVAVVLPLVAEKALNPILVVVDVAVKGYGIVHRVPVDRAMPRKGRELPVVLAAAVPVLAFFQQQRARRVLVVVVNKSILMFSNVAIHVSALSLQIYKTDGNCVRA